MQIRPEIKEKIVLALDVDTVEQAKELILKSFGYFSSSSRLAGLQAMIDQNNEKLKPILNIIF